MKTKRLLTHCLVLLLSAFIILLDARAEDSDDDISILANRLVASPAWVSMPENQVEVQGAELLSVCEEIVGMDAADARKVIVKSLEVADAASTTRVGATVLLDSNLFVLNRYYFNIPTTERRSEIKGFGGFDNHYNEKGRIDENDKNSINMLWPLSMINGRLKIVSTCGGRMGPRYKALEEFDYFLKKYGPRKSITQPRVK